MRLTVGPLPPAVYWRRRAIVLGVVLLFLIVVTYSCLGPDDPRTGASPSGSTPSAEATGPEAILTPETGSPPETGSSAPVGPTGPAQPATVQPAPPPAEGSCADEEMLITPVPAQTTLKQGTTIQLRLKIKNVSQRTCARDVGADLQELYISSGAEKIWSSDICGAAKGSNIQSFPPTIEHEYQVNWNGRDSSRCEGGVASGPFPEPGEYQLFARLGTRLSDPVTLTITG